MAEAKTKAERMNEELAKRLARVPQPGVGPAPGVKVDPTTGEPTATPKGASKG